MSKNLRKSVQYADENLVNWSASPGLRIGAKKSETICHDNRVATRDLSCSANSVNFLPIVRVGQLLAHLGFLRKDRTAKSLWDIDDEQLLELLYQRRAELLVRHSSTPPAVALPRPPAAAAPDTPVQ